MLLCNAILKCAEADKGDISTKKNVRLRTRRLTCWPFELDGYQRAKVSRCVGKRVVIAGESPFWKILNSSKVFSIGGIFAVARDPDNVSLKQKVNKNI